MSSFDAKLFTAFMQKQTAFNDTIIKELTTLKQENTKLKQRLEEIEAQLNL